MSWSWALLPLSLLAMTMHVSHCQDDFVTTLEPFDTTQGTTQNLELSNTKVQGSEVKPNIKSFHVTSNIKYRYATTLVSSRVVNPNNVSAAAAFTLTLPESAFISQFLMEIKGKEYKAYVKEKEEAKVVYDQAVQAGLSAGHVALDSRDSNQFTVSVNIEAYGKVTFNLTYEQLLSRNLGVYSNVININPQQIVEDMSVVVNIEEPTAIKNLEVPELQMSNEASPEKAKPNALAKIESKSPNQTTIVWAPTPEEQTAQNSTGVSGQFIVQYDVERQENPQQILVDEGYFVHFFAPENLPKLKKHVVFVMDFSGSMAGRKIEQLKDAMGKILSDMSPADYFSVVLFQSYVEAWSPKKGHVPQLNELSAWEREHVHSRNLNSTLDHEFVVEATPSNIDLARSYLTSYSDLGATNIIGGLRMGLKLVEIGSELWVNESNPPQPVMVFLTDGQPNVEEYDTDAIINKTKPLNTKHCPIFSLGFGYGADFDFLRKLSLSNFGFAKNIYEAADASDQLNNFYQTIASPLLSNVTFTYLPGQVDNSSNTKRNFPVYFKGSELVVAGKVNMDVVCPVANSHETKTIGELSGVTSTGLQRFPIITGCVITPTNRTSASHLEKTWAYLTIQQLLDKADSLDSSDEKNQTKKQALDLALQFSFVTPLTSLVVVKPNDSESSVDTTKVKPGVEGMPIPLAAGGYGGGAGALSAAFIPVPQSMFGPPPPMVPGVSYMMAPHSSNYGGFAGMRVPSTTFSSFDSLVTENQFVDDKTDKPLLKVSMKDIKWLQSYLTNSDSTNITVPIEGRQFVLGLNETDQSFGPCQVHNSPGECHHFEFCALDVFQDDISKFTPYQCHIDGDFLGVCCPQSVS